jgi:hypothetical protein
MVQLSDHHGKVVLLSFWATWLKTKTSERDGAFRV